MPSLFPDMNKGQTSGKDRRPSHRQGGNSSFIRSSGEKPKARSPPNRSCCGYFIGALGLLFPLLVCLDACLHGFPPFLIGMFSGNKKLPFREVYFPFLVFLCPSGSPSLIALLAEGRPGGRVGGTTPCLGPGLCQE